MKKAISAVLSLILVVTMLSFGTPAAFGAVSQYVSGDDTYEYTVQKDNTVTITDYYYTGKAETRRLKIPAAIGGRKVTVIGRKAFAQTSEKEHHPNGVKLIDVVIPNGVKTIERMAFRYNDDLKSVTIPESVTVIGTSAFFECSALADIQVGDSLQKIGSGAFTLTAYSADSGNWDAHHCLYLKNYLLRGEIADKDFAIKKGTTLIADNAFYQYSEFTLSNLSFPSSLRYIGANAFGGQVNIKAVTLNNGLVKVGTRAFCDCNFISVKIPKSVTAIGDYAFGFHTEAVVGEAPRAVKNFKVRGYKGSAAEKYAKKHALKFSALCEKAKDGEHRTKAVKAKSATYFKEGHSSYQECTLCKKKFGYKKTAKRKLAKPEIAVKAGKRSFKLTYRKVKDATGFQVKYTKGKKSYTKEFQSTQSATKTIKNLKKGKWKVQARAYIKKDNQKAYGAWSSATTINVK